MTTDALMPRPDLLAMLRDALQRGSVLLHGPRRVGKSTTLELLADRSGAELRVIRIDLEGYRERPVDALVEQVHARLRTEDLVRDVPLAQRIESVEAAGFGLSLRPGQEPGPWQRMELLVAEALASHRAGLLVIALDEVPWWLDAIEATSPGEARATLAALRRLRQHRPFRERLRFVLTGSIGLAGLAAELGASAELNDLETIALPPMPPALAASLFETELTGRGRRCGDAAAKAAARLAGGSPHWVKRLASLVGPEGAPDARAVDAAVEALLAPALRRELSDEGREHFRRRHPDLFPAMAAVLDAVSGDDDAQPWQAAVNAALQARPGTTVRQAEELILLLIDGFYLRRDPDGTLSWVNPLLRRWWQRYGGP